MRTNCTAMMDAEQVPVRRVDVTGNAASRPASDSLRDAELTVTHMIVAAGERFELPADAVRAGLVIVAEGSACFEIEGAPVRMSPGQAVLNACLGPIAGSCPAGSRVIQIALPRNATQAWASECHGGARRLMRATFVLADEAGLAALADSGCESVHADAAIRPVVAALAARYAIDTACPPSRSISLARRRLDADPSRAWDLEDLARGVGVTAVTLQRGFRDCVGVTVAGYAQRIRLGEARARLMSARETRPVSAIAHAAGFASVTAFARAYQRLFGETPTRTRAESVRFPYGDHIES
jgi:AraC-like DNA-binding protein